MVSHRITVLRHYDTTTLLLYSSQIDIFFNLVIVLDTFLIVTLGSQASKPLKSIMHGDNTLATTSWPHHPRQQTPEETKHGFASTFTFLSPQHMTTALN